MASLYTISVRLYDYFTNNDLSVGISHMGIAHRLWIINKCIFRAQFDHIIITNNIEVGGHKNNKSRQSIELRFVFFDTRLTFDDRFPIYQIRNLRKIQLLKWNGKCQGYSNLYGIMLFDIDCVDLVLFTFVFLRSGNWSRWIWEESLLIDI